MVSKDDAILLVDEKGNKVENRGFVFQDTEWNQIKENPGRLTKEGVEKKIELWQKSSNKHAVAKYQTMLNMCRNLTKSGFVEIEVSDGSDKQGKPKKRKIKLKIYSRFENDKPKWAESIEEYLEYERTS